MSDQDHSSSPSAAPTRFPIKAVLAAMLPLGMWAVLVTIPDGEIRHPFIFFVPPVLLASWWGGLPAGIAAIVLAGFGAWDFATPGTPALDLRTGGRPVDLLGLLVFLATTLLIVILQAVARRRAGRILAAERAILAHKESLESRDDIFNETNDLIQSVAADGRILYANRSWRESLGYTTDELSALNIFQIIDPDCRDHCMATFGRLMQGENVGLIEVTYAAKDGHRIDLEGNVSARMANGQMVSTRGIFRDVSARKQAEAERQAVARRLEQQNAALAALARNPALRGSDLPLAFRTITEAAAHTLGVGRASVWFYDLERGVLRCDDLLEMPAGTHSQGLALPIKDYPAYFAALADGRILAAHDAQVDPRTREFAEGYLKPLGITSLLDAAVHTDRGVAGVICCEHTAAPRQWTLDEQNFAASIADLIALTIESAERLQAEASLRASEERFRSMAESASSAIISADDTGRIIAWNLAAERMFGHSAAEAIGQPLTLIIPERLRAAHAAGMARLHRGEPSRHIGHTVELEGLRKDGSEFPLELSLSSWRQDGKTFFTGIIQDISGRKEAEDALRRREEAFRTVVEASPDGILLADDQGIITLVNAQLERWTGYARGELIGQPVEILVPARHAAAHPGHRRSYLGNPEARPMGAGRDLLVRRKDGSEFPAEVGLAPITIATGKMTLASIVDITARKQAADLLSAETQKVRMLLQTACDSVHILDAQGNVTEASGSFARGLGYPLDEALRLNVRQWDMQFQADPNSAVLEGLFDLQETHTFETRHRRKDGRLIDVEVSARPVTVSGRRLLYCASRDITARKQAEADLAKMVGKLKQSNIELEQFAYVASHDLQEPLRAISGCVQILERDYRKGLDEKAVELIGHTVAGVSRMQNLINGLLAFSRVARSDMPHTPVNLRSVLAEVRQDLASAIAESAAVITCDDLPTVTADAGQCAHLFQNLLGNALKFRGPETPAIHVSAAREGAFWKIGVRDNGIGIEPRYFDRIFSLFQRLHTREEFPGTGLGLSICQRIVQAHGGRIWLESTPGKGTTFFFTLPSA